MDIPVYAETHTFTAVCAKTLEIPQVQFWFVMPAECRHCPDSAEYRGVLHAVPDQVVGLPVVSGVT